MTNLRSIRQPTLSDVAREARVSVSTAGRVLSESSTRRVDPVLAKRVRRAANQLGYVPNALATALRTSPTPRTGLVVGDLLDPYFGEVMESVTEEAELTGQIALVGNVLRDPVREYQLCKRFWEQRVDGLILAGGGYNQYRNVKPLEEIVTRMVTAGVRVVTLSPRPFKIPTISVDNVAAGALAAQVLLDHGHRDVALVFGPKISIATEQRLQGAVDALKSAGAKVRTLTGTYSFDYGQASGEKIARMRQRPTGVISGSDMLSAGLLEGLRASRMRVPDDVSVIGMGRTFLSRVMSPALTTIDLRVGECGRLAIRSMAPGAPELAFDAPPYQPEVVAGHSVAPAPAT